MHRSHTQISNRPSPDSYRAHWQNILTDHSRNSSLVMSIDLVVNGTRVVN